MTLLHYIEDNFRKIFWSLVIFVLVYGFAFTLISLSLPQVLQYAGVFWLASGVAFVTVSLISLLVVFAIVQMCRRRRGVLGTLGYLLISLLIHFYFVLFFLLSSLAVFGYTFK